MQNFLDFEKPLLEIRTKIEELRHLKDTSENIANELTVLQDKFDKKLDEIYENLTPMQKVKVCRHQDRPTVIMRMRMPARRHKHVCGRAPHRALARPRTSPGCHAWIKSLRSMWLGLEVRQPRMEKHKTPPPAVTATEGPPRSTRPHQLLAEQHAPRYH